MRQPMFTCHQDSRQLGQMSPPSGRRLDCEPTLL